MGVDSLDLTRDGGCPVCGYADFVAYTPAEGWASYEICACCRYHAGVDLGYRPDEDGILYLRCLWLKEGRGAWWSSAVACPSDWDPVRQLFRFVLPDAIADGTHWVDSFELDEIRQLASTIAGDGEAVWNERIVLFDAADPGRAANRAWRDLARRVYGAERWPGPAHRRAFRAGALRCIADTFERIRLEAPTDASGHDAPDPGPAAPGSAAARPGDGMRATDRPHFLPPEREPLLAWYDGHYRRAFVALHPFLRLPGFDPRALPFAASLGTSGPETPRSLGGAAGAEGDPAMLAAFADGAKVSGEPVAWRAVRALAGLDDHRAVVRSLMTLIEGFWGDDRDEAGAERLRLACDTAGLFRPSVGALQPVMERGLRQLLVRTGLDAVVLADEFGARAQQVPVADLPEDRAWGLSPEWLGLDRVSRILAPDRSLLVATHWNSPFTLIFGTEARLAEADVAGLFEGFWCEEATKLDWCFQPPVALAESVLPAAHRAAGAT